MCLREQGGLRREKCGTEPASEAVRTHTTFINKLIVLYGYNLWCPKTITIVILMITDHHNKYSSNEKVQNIARITKM